MSRACYSMGHETVTLWDSIASMVASAGETDRDLAWTQLA
jgi:hypothetical protein